MALVDSLLSSIVRADGDALVMHVGERPYVVVGTQTINISTHGLNLEAMAGMLGQLLPADSQAQLEEFGAVEHKIPPHGDDRFSIVAARGGDDIWIEIRRRRAPPVVASAADTPQPPEAISIVEPHVAPEPGAIVNSPLEPVAIAAEEIAQPESVSAPAPEPVIMQVPEPEPRFEPVILQVIDDAAPAFPEPEPEIVFVEFDEPDEPVVAKVPPESTAQTIAEPVAEPRLEVSEPGPLPIAAPIEEPQAMPIAGSIEHPEPGTHSVVQPMTRRVRIEVPPRTLARAASGIERLLRIAAARGAAALFVTSDSRPWIRVEGELRPLDSEPLLTRADVESAILGIAPDSGHESIGKGEPTEWIAEFPDVGRIRCTTFADHRGAGVLLRMIATRAVTAEQLGLASEVEAMATEPHGLVLVAGSRASGKSTLISALVDLVNRQRAEFVITLERQVRLVHDNQAALVSQREVHGGADDAVAAARAALRENPDVLVVDDLVSPHMVAPLVSAASEGVLVFVSIAAPSTTDAAQRFVELAPPEMRKAVQTAMAASFRGAVAQVLLKRAGGGVIAVREILLGTAPVTRAISEGQFDQLPLALESGREHGMVSFTDALSDYVRDGSVDMREAFRKTPDRARLIDSLKRDGIDTSVVERLA